MKKLSLFILGLFLLSPVAASAATVSVGSIQSGDLIRGATFSAVYYYGADGLRYVFPNDKTYFTWYKNFDNVKWLSDKDLATIQIGGNVTYKPGVKMLKINSDPQVYAVSTGGTLRPIPSETIAASLYGSDWNKKIDDVPDGFFPNYTIGKSIESAAGFSVTAETAEAVSINMDKDLKPATQVTITSSGYSPSTVTISAGTAVRFTNNDSAKHSASGDDKSWGTGTLASGKHFSRYFKEAGTYTYTDAYGTAKGTIIVQ